ncbi:MAG: HAMP domain-containing sensor histidine kinase [Acidimicrobiia bacterium]
MRTVSLRRRVVRIGVAAVVLVLLGGDAFVYLSVRDHLIDNLGRLLDGRAALAQGFGPDFTPYEVARLAGSEVRVSVLGPDGTPITASIDHEPPGAPLPAPRPWLTRRVVLPDGNVVVLIATHHNMDRTLREVLVSEVFGTVTGLGLALLLLGRASRVALRPIDTVVATARRIQSGRTGERLRPDRTNTELGQMALAFDEMLDGLEAALGEARASDEAARRFLAEAAHQLRTPIAGIQASVEALPAVHDDAEREELLASVAREAVRAGRRVAALLRMARLDQGGEPVRRVCDVVALSREEAERIAGMAPGLHVAFEADRPSMTVEVDPDGVREALANLLDNARRHARTTITVRVSVDQGAFEARIEDDGPGVPAGDHERVFERFVSLDGHGGTGLGLAIARGIARAHGGDVRCRDGAFVLAIPIPEPPDPLRAASPEDLLKRASAAP